MPLAAWLNKAWMLKCRGEWRAFAHATRNVAQAQAQVLAEIVANNCDTAFGRQHQFDAIHAPREFQDRVPIATYDALAPWSERAQAGEPNVLTREPVRLFEPTSGSTGGEKLIPYTDALRRQFHRGIAAWIADLFANRPAVRRGRAYWSISPAFGARRRTSGGIPIGFDDDAAYLGRLERFALKRLLVVPAAVARLDVIEQFRYVTLSHLLAAGDLSLISIWHPSFLSRLVDGLEAWWEPICRDLRAGARWGPDLAIRPAPRRAEAIARVCRATSDPVERLRGLWPQLALVSCWGDAAAALPLAELRRLLPAVEIQPKGLLATECFVSLPLAQGAAALAIRSHFFEFQEIDSTARPYLAHEVECGGRYRVVVTTGGGLYRYHLNDEVEIVGFHKQCPLLRFVGKADCTSDLVGEKLSEPHVRAALDRVLTAHRQTARFSLLAPLASKPPRYRLYLQLDGEPPSAASIAALASDLHEALAANPHYRYAIGLGQLVSLEVALLDPSGPAANCFEAECLRRGQRLGNIKPALLDRWTGWEEVYRPLTIATEPAGDRSRTSPPAIPAARR